MILTDLLMNYSATVLNRVPREKLPQVLSHILEKRATSPDASNVFTLEEMQQLTVMLQLSEDEITQVVTIATLIFQQAAAFGDGIAADVLMTDGVDSEVVGIIEKLWRKKGLHVVDDLVQAMPLAPTATLKQSLWRLHVELANRYLGKQSEPLAVFQLDIVDKDKSEKVDIEMNHNELFAFFQQLNTIQKALDESTTP